MLTIEWRRRLIEQESTNLTDVNERRAIILDAVFPEVGSAEFLAQDHCGARHERGADPNHSTICVVDWKAYVDDVFVGEASCSEKDHSACIVTRLFDDGRLKRDAILENKSRNLQKVTCIHLWQTSCSAGVDEQHDI